MTSPRTVHTQAILVLVLVNLSWGASFPLLKAIGLTHQQVLPGSGNWFVTAYMIAPRFLLATLVLLVWFGSRLRTITRAEVSQGLLLGLSTGTGLWLQNDGLQFTSASVSAFLTSLYAILIPLWVALRESRRPSARVLLCSCLVLAGVAILGRFDFRALRLGRGEIETLLSSVFFTMQILVLARRDFAGNRAMPVTLVMFAVQGVMFFAAAAAFSTWPADLLVPWTSPTWLALTVLLTVFCTVGAFLLMNAWQPKITPTEAGLIYCGEPVFASIAALFLPALLSAWAGIDYPNEWVTWHLLAGGGLITLANVLLQLDPPMRS